MRISPFIQPRCLSCISCGISTGFPVLSPSQRQIAHALLTSPPLSYTKHTVLCSAMDNWQWTIDNFYRQSFFATYQSLLAQFYLQWTVDNRHCTLKVALSLFLFRRALRDSFIVNYQLSIVNYKALCALCISVRLACVKHAASVRPEPGSNSQLNP